MSTKKSLKEQSINAEKPVVVKAEKKDWTKESQKLLEAGYLMSKTGELYTWKPATITKIDKT